MEEIMCDDSIATQSLQDPIDVMCLGGVLHEEPHLVFTEGGDHPGHPLRGRRYPPELLVEPIEEPLEFLIRFVCARVCHEDRTPFLVDVDPTCQSSHVLTPRRLQQNDRIDTKMFYNASVIPRVALCFCCSKLISRATFSNGRICSKSIS